MRQIIQLQLGRIAGAHSRRTIAPQFIYDDALVDAITARCTEVESGARNVDHILTRTLLPEISREVLGAHGGGRAAHIGADHGGRVGRRSSTPIS